MLFFKPGKKVTWPGRWWARPLRLTRTRAAWWASWWCTAPRPAAAQRPTAPPPPRAWTSRPPPMRVSSRGTDSQAGWPPAFYVIYIMEILTHRRRIPTEEEGKGRRSCLGIVLECRSSHLECKDDLNKFSLEEHPFWEGDDHPFFQSIHSASLLFYLSISSNHPAKALVWHLVESIPSPNQQRRHVPFFCTYVLTVLAGLQVLAGLRCRSMSIHMYRRIRLLIFMDPELKIFS